MSNENKLIEWEDFTQMDLILQIAELAKAAPELRPKMDICNIPQKGKDGKYHDHAFVRASGWDRIRDNMGYHTCSTKWINEDTWQKSKVFTAECRLKVTKDKVVIEQGHCGIDEYGTNADRIHKAQTRARSRATRIAYRQLSAGVDELNPKMEKKAKAIEVEVEEEDDYY
jgi:hypothetical protein